MTPNYGKSARETPGQGHGVSALMAAPVGQDPANIADSTEVARLRSGEPPLTWDEYDRMLALFDAGLVDSEPEGPHAELEPESELAPNRIPFRERPEPGPPPMSDRTERRHRGERRGEIKALLARDGRRTVRSAADRVWARRSKDDRKWMKVCDHCAAVFEATRSDARFCSEKCRKAFGRAR